MKLKGKTKSQLEKKMNEWKNSSKENTNKFGYIKNLLKKMEHSNE